MTGDKVSKVSENGFEVRYKCSCMGAEVSIFVPFRNEGEDIRDWMANCVQAALYVDHRKRSPFCAKTTMEYAKILMPESSPFIGADHKKFLS